MCPTWKPATFALALLASIGAGPGGPAYAQPTPARSTATPGSSDTGGAGHAAARPALTVTVAEARRVSLPRALPATGPIAAWQEAIVAPEIGGYQVASVEVDVGAVVHKGQPLATLRRDFLEADLSARRAAHAQARASLASARSVLARAEPLREPGAISDEELDRLRTEVLTAQARLASAEAELGAAHLRLGRARIVAPDDGIITSRTVVAGQIAQAGAEMFRLMRQGRLEWRAEVPEARIRELAPGQRARLQTADGSTLRGRVRSIAPVVKEADRSVVVYVDLERGSASDATHASTASKAEAKTAGAAAAAGGSRLAARPGQFARGEIELPAQPALVVPLAAMVVQDGLRHVFVLGADGRVQRRQVEPGAIAGDTVEIRQGLRAGDRVVTQGAGFLRDGDPVAVAAASPVPPATSAPATSAATAAPAPAGSVR